MSARNFPNRGYDDVAGFFEDYRSELALAWESVDRRRVTAAGNILEACYDRGKQVFSCGNGGSAAISNHLVCDHLKGIRTGSKLSPKVISLSQNVELLTAISNDIGYGEVFKFQLESLATPGDVVFLISASGNSANIVRAARWAKENDLHTIGLVGFGGGELARLADVSVHVASENYGIVEDVHQGIMHMIAQFLRQKHMNEASIAETRF